MPKRATCITILCLFFCAMTFSSCARSEGEGIDFKVRGQHEVGFGIGSK